MKNIKYIILAVAFSLALANNYLFISDTDNKASSVEIERNITMPPSLSLITVALGPVRGLIVDALWWKVAELQESSDYFEILRITDWITVMQPHNSFVWTFHAWNLSYNISNEFPTPETRWKWVYSGIKLLRDEGLKYNPHDKFIENELGWVFYDRLCGYSDTDQQFFQKKWNNIMSKYMPTGKRTDIERLINPTTDSDKLLAIELKKKENLELSRMLKIDREYGPFQWKLPQAHAIYWAARDNYKDYWQGDLNYTSTVTSALQQAFLHGTLFEDKKNKIFITTNNLEVTDNIIKDFKKRIAVTDIPNFEKDRFKNFIMHAAPILDSFGKKDLALKLFKEFKKIDSNNSSNFDDFISENLEQMNKKPIARYDQSLVEISLFNAYLYLSQGDFKKAATFEQHAQKQWNYHQKRFAGNKVKLLPPIEYLKITAFIKFLTELEKPQQLQLLDLVHNKMAAELKIDKKISFNSYLK